MRKLFLFAAAAMLIALGGCDSGDPDDGTDPHEVAGIYQFTEYLFEPSGTGFQPINVLDTLNMDVTELLLTSDGDLQLRYQFVNGGLYHADGSFSVRPLAVTIEGESDDEVDFTRLLLDRTFTLRRDPAQPELLSAEIPKTINPSAFSDRYSGVESMTGTLYLTIARQ